MQPDNMENLSTGHILLSLFLSASGTVGGWALTGKLAGKEAALSFVQVGFIAVLVLSLLQIIFFNLGKSRLIYRIVFNIAFGCGTVWFMLCLLLPMFWVPSVGIIGKSIISLILLLLSVSNVFKASTQFEARWKFEGEKALARYYNGRDKTIDWPKVLVPMKFSVALYIPGVSEKIIPFISVSIILFMVSGLSLRNAYPIFSLYAWGIPSCLVISIFAQVLGLGLAQIIKLVDLEKKFGNPIRPKS